jgi:hypothetical protein
MEVPMESVSVIDLRAPATGDLLVWAGDELATCLDRFLTATADEATMARARHALLLWQATTAAG